MLPMSYVSSPYLQGEFIIFGFFFLISGVLETLIKSMGRN